MLIISVFFRDDFRLELKNWNFWKSPESAEVERVFLSEIKTS